MRERAQHLEGSRGLPEGLLLLPGQRPAGAEARSRRRSAQWGLAKDEFTDTGHWPNQLYIREARRMVGEFVATQKDLQTERTKPDAIGMGSYNSDSHNVQRFVNDKRLRRRTRATCRCRCSRTRFPTACCSQRRTRPTNLLVPVCFSASHIAYSSLRMEPQYMILGHASGVAAAIAVKSGSAVQDVNVAELQKQLLMEGAVFELGAEFQARGLAAIRRNQQSSPARRRAPWARPAIK